MSNSKFIVLEGIDGSGKSTQLTLLSEYLNAQGIPFKQLHFPRLDSAPFGPMIAGFLRGDYGSLDQVHPSLVALLYAEDRHDFAPQLRSWLDDGNVVIMDRYVFSNIAFQCAKAKGEDAKSNLKDWILDLEYVYFNIPQPALTIYMDLPVGSARGAMESDTTRATRNYLDGEMDIHESDHSFQESVRDAYVGLAKSEQNVETVQCLAPDGRRYSAQEVHGEILRILTNYQILPDKQNQ